MFDVLFVVRVKGESILWRNIYRHVKLPYIPHVGVQIDCGDYGGFTSESVHMFLNGACEIHLSSVAPSQADAMEKTGRWVKQIPEGFMKAYQEADPIPATDCT